jgi:hypothetical protein
MHASLAAAPRVPRTVRENVEAGGAGDAGDTTWGSNAPEAADRGVGHMYVP